MTMATRTIVTVVLVLTAVLQWTNADLTSNDCDGTVISKNIQRQVCSRRNFQNGDIVHPDPANSHQFVVCTDVMVGCGGTCPNSQAFSIISKDCGPTQQPCPNPPGADPKGTNSLNINDPCQAGSKFCKYLPYPGNNKKFVICDRETVRKEGICLPGLVFNEKLQMCQSDRLIKCVAGTKYCKKINHTDTMIDAHLLYFGCTNDLTMFIQCDIPGRQFVKYCKNKTIWCDDILVCCNR